MPIAMFPHKIKLGRKNSYVIFILRYIFFYKSKSYDRITHPSSFQISKIMLELYCSGGSWLCACSLLGSLSTLLCGMVSNLLERYILVLLYFFLSSQLGLGRIHIWLDTGQFSQVQIFIRLPDNQLLQ